MVLNSGDKVGAGAGEGDEGVGLVGVGLEGEGNGESGVGNEFSGTSTRPRSTASGAIVEELKEPGT
jgi:hypothetical protein